MTSAGGDWLATGGADETIRVYNLRRKRDMGALHSHAGAVTCLEFFGKQHLLSGSDDGTLRIWRVSDWACLHVLGGHKAGVTSIAIHPTGRLALSTSSDKTVRLWNLMEGRNAYISRLTSLPIPEKVQFSTDGNHYALLFRNQVLVYSVASGEIVAHLEHEHVRLSDFCYVGPQHLVTGANDGKLRLWSTDAESEGTLVEEYDGGMGKERIRALERLQDNRIVTLYTNGLVQVWEYSSGGNDDGDEPSLVRHCSLTRVAKTGSRATCLASCTFEGGGGSSSSNTTLSRMSSAIAATGTGGEGMSHGGIVNKEKEKMKKPNLEYNTDLDL
jgi:protein MAK11